MFDAAAMAVSSLGLAYSKAAVDPHSTPKQRAAARRRFKAFQESMKRSCEVAEARRRLDLALKGKLSCHKFNPLRELGHDI